MWLLDTETIKLRYFNTVEEIANEYLILSHTWDEEEVSFDEIQHLEARSKKGYLKIELICNKARKQGIRYAWVDTCCIDKRSSAELTEAINSMFNWYANARACVVYLADVYWISWTGAMDSWVFRQRNTQQFGGSRWFTRGWTLQELIAPENVLFYDSRWQCLGDKVGLMDRLETITGIEKKVLQNRSALKEVSVARKMSWAAKRKTSRPEDRAYSLLGLFDINMPMLYGEGSRAFQRLQEEIIRTSLRIDHSILAWGSSPYGLGYDEDYYDLHEDQPRVFAIDSPTLLSPTPDEFSEARQVVSWERCQTEPFELSQRGLTLVAFLRAHGTRHSAMGEQMAYLAALNCRPAVEPTTHVECSQRYAIRLVERPRIQPLDNVESVAEDTPIYDRSWVGANGQERLMILPVMNSNDSRWVKSTITIARQPFLYPLHGDRIHIRADHLNICLPTDKVPWGLGDGEWLRLDVTECDLQVVVEVSLFEKSANETTIVHINIKQAADRTIPPHLYVRTDGTAPNHRGFLTGETQRHPIAGSSGQMLDISARYVDALGDLLWSIQIKPTNVNVAGPRSSRSLKWS